MKNNLPENFDWLAMARCTFNGVRMLSGTAKSACHKVIFNTVCKTAPTHGPLASHHCSMCYDVMFCFLAWKHDGSINQKCNISTEGLEGTAMSGIALLSWQGPSSHEKSSLSCRPARQNSGGVQPNQRWNMVEYPGTTYAALLEKDRS